MSRAFTLIEMLITVSIIAIITTFTVVNLNFERPERRVEQVTRELYGTLLYARDLSIAGKIFKDQNGDGIPDVPNGYGVSITRAGSFAQYLMYGDSVHFSQYGMFDWVNEELSSLIVWETDIIIDINFGAGIVNSPSWNAQYFFPTPSGDPLFFLDYIQRNVEIVILTVSYKNNLSINESIIMNVKTGQIYVVE